MIWNKSKQPAEQDARHPKNLQQAAAALLPTWIQERRPGMNAYDDLE